MGAERTELTLTASVVRVAGAVPMQAGCRGGEYGRALRSSMFLILLLLKLLLLLLKHSYQVRLRVGESEQCVHIQTSH